MHQFEKLLVLLRVWDFRFQVGLNPLSESFLAFAVLELNFCTQQQTHTWVEFREVWQVLSLTVENLDSGAESADFLPFLPTENFFGKGGVEKFLVDEESRVSFFFRAARGTDKDELIWKLWNIFREKETRVVEPLVTREAFEHLDWLRIFKASTDAKLTLRSFVVVVLFIFKIFLIIQLALSHGHARVATIALEIYFIPKVKSFMLFMAINQAAEAEAMWLNPRVKFLGRIVASFAAVDWLKEISLCVGANSRVL